MTVTPQQFEVWDSLDLDTFNHDMPPETWRKKDGSAFSKFELKLIGETTAEHLTEIGALMGERVWTSQFDVKVMDLMGEILGHYKFEAPEVVGDVIDRMSERDAANFRTLASMLSRAV